MDRLLSGENSSLLHLHKGVKVDLDVRRPLILVLVLLVAIETAKILVTV